VVKEAEGRGDGEEGRREKVERKGKRKVGEWYRH
jgi:hypothetical protein